MKFFYSTISMILIPLISLSQTMSKVEQEHYMTSFGFARMTQEGQDSARKFFLQDKRFIKQLNSAFTNPGKSNYDDLKIKAKFEHQNDFSSNDLEILLNLFDSQKAWSLDSKERGINERIEYILCLQKSRSSNRNNHLKRIDKKTKDFFEKLPRTQQEELRQYHYKYYKALQSTFDRTQKLANNNFIELAPKIKFYNNLYFEENIDYPYSFHLLINIPTESPEIAVPSKLIKLYKKFVKHQLESFDSNNCQPFYHKKYSLSQHSPADFDLNIQKMVYLNCFRNISPQDFLENLESYESFMTTQLSQIIESPLSWSKFSPEHILSEDLFQPSEGLIEDAYRYSFNSDTSTYDAHIHFVNDRLASELIFEDLAYNTEKFRSYGVENGYLILGKRCEPSECFYFTLVNEQGIITINLGIKSSDTARLHILNDIIPLVLNP